MEREGLGSPRPCEWGALGPGTSTSQHKPLSISGLNLGKMVPPPAVSRCTCCWFLVTWPWAVLATWSGHIDPQSTAG